MDCLLKIDRRRSFSSHGAHLIFRNIYWFYLLFCTCITHYCIAGTITRSYVTWSLLDFVPNLHFSWWSMVFHGISWGHPISLHTYIKHEPYHLELMAKCPLKCQFGIALGMKIIVKLRKSVTRQDAYGCSWQFQAATRPSGRCPCPRCRLNIVLKSQLFSLILSKDCASSYQLSCHPR